jgi:hypothetical protein
VTVHPCLLPAGAILDAYADNGSYTDCFSLELARPVSHPQFVEAFYTSAVFRLERRLIASFLSLRATDADARELASGSRDSFSAWTVERREPNQLLLAAGRTRSWLMVDGAGTTLYFGSAVTPRRSDGLGGMGWRFKVLLGFHKLYSRVLLAAAGRKLGALA